MMSESILASFTDRAKKVMRLASNAAQHMEHEYVGTEHLLVGLAEEGHSIAWFAMKNLGIGLEEINNAMARLITPTVSVEGMPLIGRLPCTPRVKRAIELARDDADQLGHKYLGPEHLILGLIRDPESAGAQILVSLGVDFAALRAEVLISLGKADPPPGEQRRSPTGLLPCPFCDSVNLTAIRIKGGSIRMIECNECRASGPVHYVRPDQYDETEVPAEVDERVRSLWDRRAGHAAT